MLGKIAGALVGALSALDFMLRFLPRWAIPQTYKGKLFGAPRLSRRAELVHQRGNERVATIAQLCCQEGDNGA